MRWQSTPRRRASASPLRSSRTSGGSGRRARGRRRKPAALEPHREVEFLAGTGECVAVTARATKRLRTDEARAAARRRVVARVEEASCRSFQPVGSSFAGVEEAHARDPGAWVGVSTATRREMMSGEGSSASSSGKRRYRPRRALCQRLRPGADRCCSAARQRRPP